MKTKFIGIVAVFTILLGGALVFSDLLSKSSNIDFEDDEARRSGLQNFKDSCSSEIRLARIECLFPYFEQVVQDYSASVAITDARELYQSGYIDDCHLVAHEIGHVLYEKEKDLGVALSKCTEQCIQGCYHGVTEHYLATSKFERDDLRKNISSICNLVEGDEILYRQCTHGLGHGLMVAFHNDVEEAVEFCSYLPSFWHSNTCQGGVFMEHVAAFLGYNEQTLGENLSNICDTIIPTELQSECLRAVGEGLMFYFAHDLDKALSLCTVLSVEEQVLCAHGAREQVEVVKIN